MNINIQYVKMPFSQSMTEFVLNKLQELEERYRWITKAQVFFKMENNTRGPSKVCEIKISAPGAGVFASAREMDFALAAKQAAQEIERQLNKRKTVLYAR